MMAFSRRCAGSGQYIHVDTPRTIGRRCTCPVCGRLISFHAITGRIARHDRPAEEK